MRKTYSTVGWIILLFSAVGLLAVFQHSVIPADAQALVTATPARITLPSPTPLPAVQQDVTPTYTPTSEQAASALTGVLLEARSDSGAVNVRAEPDPNAEILGTINVGTQYPVTGRYFRWLRLVYERSPSGTAWVFDGLVDIIGDSATIPEIDPFAQPTPDPLIVGATQTAELILVTPGGESVQGTPLPERLQEGSGSGPLPTYTYPPDLAAFVSTDPAVQPASDSAVPADSGAAVAPIIPIVVLGSFGLLGLAVSALRRGR